MFLGFQNLSKVAKQISENSEAMMLDKEAIELLMISNWPSGTIRLGFRAHSRKLQALVASCKREPHQ